MSEEAVSSPTPLLEVEHLQVHFPVHQGILQRPIGVLKAVDDVSFTLDTGQTLGLVGESGCGKTTVGRAILRLIPIDRGRIAFQGQTINDLPRRQMQKLRREMQIIFQDPAGSLNPRMRVGEIVAEPLLVHHIAEGPELRDRCTDLLERCGLPADSATALPP